jgi:hypothetical protein
MSLERLAAPESRPERTHCHACNEPDRSRHRSFNLLWVLEGFPPSTNSNPTEWTLETIGAASNVNFDIDWPTVWRSSDEYISVQAAIQHLKDRTRSENLPVGASYYAELAASLLISFDMPPRGRSSNTGVLLLISSRKRRCQLTL